MYEANSAEDPQSILNKSPGLVYTIGTNQCRLKRGWGLTIQKKPKYDFMLEHIEPNFSLLLSAIAESADSTI